MNKLHYNMPLMIFVTGAVVFLLAPLTLVPMFTTAELAMTGLFIEALGIATGFVWFLREKAGELS